MEGSDEGMEKIASITLPSVWTEGASLLKVLDYEGRGGVTVITQASENTISHLLMRNATPSDSGTYSCTPSNGRRATTTVHVLNGEPQAESQQPVCLSAGPQRAAATLRGTQGSSAFVFTVFCCP
ncbi:hypothetical protein E2C01_001917 [Portunus trituberculatus]|uniref:Ig-like domain-containing protein n=1 Tax=Portunus trituberculatus TaxID=210409 RepID=A0A5B7CJG8_PORTR|nr:hypothetical protein [Portunus trituberculatus]